MKSRELVKSSVMIMMEHRGTRVSQEPDKVNTPSDVLGPGGECGRPIRPPALRRTPHGRQIPQGPADTIF